MMRLLMLSVLQKVQNSIVCYFDQQYKPDSTWAQILENPVRLVKPYLGKNKKIVVLE